jgi:HipA-like C-terminal domain
MSEFQVIDVSDFAKDFTREVGRVPKTWLEDPQLGRVLFKDALLDNTAIDWSEKIVAEVGNDLGLPTAKYDLATYQGRAGVISYDCLPTEHFTVKSGTTFLNELSDNSPYHSVDRVMDALDAQGVMMARNEQKPTGIESGSDAFVGMLALDALTINRDRHSDNWSVVQFDDGSYELMPAYDLGLTLGAGAPLGTEPTSDSWQGSRFNRPNSFNYQTTHQAFEQAARRNPQAAKIWQQQVAKITDARIDELFDRLPPDRIAPAQAEFSKAAMRYNRDRIIAFDPSIEKLQSSANERGWRDELYDSIMAMDDSHNPQPPAMVSEQPSIADDDILAMIMSLDEGSAITPNYEKESDRVDVADSNEYLVFDTTSSDRDEYLDFGNQEDFSMLR